MRVKQDLLKNYSTILYYTAIPFETVCRFSIKYVDVHLTEGVYKLINEPHFLGFVCSDISSRQHHVEGRGQTHLTVTN